MSCAPAAGRCYPDAMRDYAGDEKLGAVPDDAAVTAAVGIRPRSDGGLGLTVRLAVAVPGLHRAVAEKIVERGHVQPIFPCDAKQHRSETIILWSGSPKNAQQLM